MNDIIIHISDLHISDQSGRLGVANKYTYLTCSTDNQNLDYINLFIDEIKKIECRNRYLVITGDISNIAEEIEFEEAAKNIKYLIAELKIDKNNLLLLPGDHDVHRDSIKIELRKGETTNGEDLHEIKFKNFNILYNNLKEVDFDYSKLIFDEIIIDDIILLAINSNSKVNQHGGQGYLDTNQLDKELKLIKESHPNKEIVLCLHHNLEGEHEDTSFGQWNPVNQKNLVALFERYNIKCILNGNEHTPNSKKLADREDIIVSDSGAFSSKDSIEASFKVYQIINSENNLSLRNEVYGLRKLNAVRETNFGSWIHYDYDGIKNVEIEAFILRKTNNLVLEKTDDLPVLEDTDETAVISDQVDTGNSILKYENEKIQNTLYKIIKNKKLFHQGHFHWSETSRAHNWIDTARLLEDKEDLYFIKNAVIDVLEQMKLIENTDLIIGLGYEGNIISSKTSIKYNIPYTYLPYSYRWQDHNDFENKLNFENSSKKFKQVILITDVVNDGRTIRKLVGKETREKEFFDNVDKIIVVSLFYTGHKNVNADILNYDTLTLEEQKGDENINNIEYYTIQHLKIEKCPYGEGYREECFILKDNLHCVHKFYTEKM
jgi:orotate phosphoribosyltransferase